METTIVQNQMEKKMENDMETGVMYGLIMAVLIYNPYYPLYSLLLGAGIHFKHTCKCQSAGLLWTGHNSHAGGFGGVAPVENLSPP